MRKPAVAGQFYPSSPERLKLELENCFEGLKIKEDKSVVGAVCPHAGYVYSGRTAAHSYAVIPHVETYVILCPNHTGYGSAVSLSTDTWLTPLGRLEVDMEFVDALPKHIIDLDEVAHLHEHSLEVQLPFLQYRFGGSFKIVPICLGLQDQETASEVGMEIREAIETTGRRVVVIASSDFTHYMPHEVAKKNDLYVIEAILNLDPDEFYRRLGEIGASVCGYGAIASMIYAVGDGRAELLDYSTSGEITGDYRSVVGYASIVVRK